jgi:ATP adenylyltransferase
MDRNSKIMLKKGTLWERVQQATEHALRIGAQLPLPTHYEFIEDRGARFVVRILKALKRKDEEKKRQKQLAVYGKPANPFLPYDKSLFVADISQTHVALLNKFNVINHHLLIVTRHYENQDTLLTIQDFMALQACMNEYRGLGFYNGGEAAGASQEHKHLQMVPLPIAPEGPAVPLEPLFSDAVFENTFGTIPLFSFQHVFARLEDKAGFSLSDKGQRTFELYRQMLETLGLETPSKDTLKIQSVPYCLLITREWMLLVPRSREFADSISINSLGFAGSFFVRSMQQMNYLKNVSPMNALERVALAV